MKKKLIILLFLFNFFPSYTYSEIVYLDVQFILDNSEIGKYYKKKLKIDNDRTKSELDTEGAIIKKKEEEINNKKNLLKKIPILNSQIYEINIKNTKLKNIAREYEKKIKKYFNGKKICFDLTLLGVGNDGHIASLFKNNINKINKKNVDFVIRKDFKRITLTIKCINNSKNIFLWAPGQSKKKIIKNIIKDKTLTYPASYLKSKNNFLFHSN